MKEPKTLDDAFSKITDELFDVFYKKHQDYGKGNILETKELGIAYRVSDKLSRLKNLLERQKQPQNETIDDTWVDIGVYAVIALLYKRGWFQNLELSNKSKKMKK